MSSYLCSDERGGTDGVGGNILSPSLYFWKVGLWEDLQVRLSQAASLFAPPSPLLGLNQIPGCGQCHSPWALLGLSGQFPWSPCHQLSTLTSLSPVLFGRPLTSSGLNAVSLPCDSKERGPLDSAPHLCAFCGAWTSLHPSIRHSMTCSLTE